MATIQNTKELVKLVVSGYKVYGQAKADGKIDLKDLGLLLALLPDIEAAFKDVSEIPAEVKDLDATEAAELGQFIVSELGALPEKTAAIINESLQVIIHAYKLVIVIRGSGASAQA
jgi:hypothetical protein